jgi:hypothetical protein
LLRSLRLLPILRKIIPLNIVSSEIIEVLFGELHKQSHGAFSSYVHHSAFHLIHSQPAGLPSIRTLLALRFTKSSMAETTNHIPELFTGGSHRRICSSLAAFNGHSPL